MVGVCHSKIIYTTNPVSGGNGDELINTAMKAVQGQDIITERINIRGEKDK